MFKPDQTVLFQGDSITDANRRRGRKGPNDPAALGHGYAFHTAAEILRRFPEMNLQIYDRGISGDKVYQLADRWEKDCLRFKPDVLSILVGVNDYCHVHFHGYGGTLVEYENDYDTLLERTRAALPDIKLILGEPFLLKAGSITEAHVEGIGAYREAARRIADKHKALWVPYQQVFNDALKLAPAEYWAPDGVHPTVAGHMLMSKAWLAAADL
ncbi:MAG: SGNH/GDSL hydrolase family protein [Phycisphaerales bacterium]